MNNTPNDPNISGLVPLRTSLAAMEKVTQFQKDKLSELIQGHHANSASLYVDAPDSDNLLFRLYRTASGEGVNVVILYGLIEPDGRCHTRPS